jgi:hypothetical protein
MIELNPTQVFDLSLRAYKAQTNDEALFRKQVDIQLPFVNSESMKVITATTGLFTPVASGFGFMAFLRRAGQRVADTSVAIIRWVFGLLHLSVNTMARQAIQLVGQ